jgi:hypothetical protein
MQSMTFAGTLRALSRFLPFDLDVLVLLPEAEGGLVTRDSIYRLVEPAAERFLLEQRLQDVLCWRSSPRISCSMPDETRPLMSRP